MDLLFYYFLSFFRGKLANLTFQSEIKMKYCTPNKKSHPNHEQSYIMWNYRGGSYVY